MVNGIFWFIAWQFYTYYFQEKQKPFLSQVMYAAWMSLIITIPLNLKKVRLIFKKQSNE